MGDGRDSWGPVGASLGGPSKLIGRIFAVIWAVREGRGLATLADIAHKTGLPKSTVHRLLAKLQYYDAVRREGDWYHLGKSVREMALPCGINGVKTLRRVMKPILSALYERTHCIVGLGIPGEMSVEFLDLVYGDDYCPLIGQIEEGSALDVSAAGKVLLAYDPQLVIDFITRAAGRRDEADLSRLPPSLRAELTRIRRQGLAVSAADSAAEVAAAAVPVFDADGRPVAALTIGAYPDRFDVAAASGLLRQASTYARHALRRHSWHGRDVGGPDGRPPWR